jgi:hypothetical protein
MPRDNLPEQEPPVKKPNWLDRMFDDKSDGRFVKRLLIVMLLIATAVQPLSLIYTAYHGHGEFDPARWWEYTPALAVLLFVALDWTIMPLTYFFATTRKPGLKILLGLMIIVVTGGAFDGYFVATERFIAMRLEEITGHALKVEEAKAEVAVAKSQRQDMVEQQERERQNQDKKRSDLSKKVETIDQQIATIMANAAADKAQHKENLAQIEKMCRAVNYVCMGPKMFDELAREKGAQADFATELDKLRAEKAGHNTATADLGTGDDKQVEAANEAVMKAEANRKDAQREFDRAAFNSQVYRWASVLHLKSARDVTADQANRILMIFAGMVAAGYVVAQVMMAISYYGRDRKGVVESTKINWPLAVRCARAYYARKRRGVYRIKKEIEYVPTGERTRVVYVPVNPGGPVPPAEEFVNKSATPATPLRAASND